MFIVVDLVIVAIILLCVLMGYKRGLTGCLVKLLAFFVALAIAVILFKPVSAIIINNTQIDEKIQTSIVEVFESEDSESEEDQNNSPIMKYVSDEIESATEEKKKEIVNNVAQDTSVKIVNILAFILLYILARILLIFVKFIANIITKLPIIKQCDKIGGVLYGVLQGLLTVFILLALITFISTIVNQYALLEMINKSYIGSILYNNNILLKVIF